MSIELNIYTKKNEIWFDFFLKSRNIELDIYYDTSFLNLDAKMQKGDYEIAVLYKDNNLLIYPYIKLPILVKGFTNYYDITSPYGYAGPYSNSRDADFLKNAELLLIKYFVESNIVSEFIRYHYNYNKEFFFTNNIVNLFNRNIVTVDLRRNAEEIWATEFSSKCRNLYRKTESEEYVFEFSTDLKDLQTFFNLYIETMKNVRADEFYYFDNAIIQQTFVDLKDKVKLVKIVKDGITFASALFFIRNKIVTYYLSARNIQHTKVNATNYLLAKTIMWAANEENVIFNLGGGNNCEEGNLLLNFKKNFSSTITPFYIGKRIHYISVYNELIKAYQQTFGNNSYQSKKHILQFYR